MGKAYPEDFHKDRDKKTRHAAEIVVSRLLEIVPSVTSAVDVGCGIGTWLAVLKEHGTEEIHGIDGDWVRNEMLMIPPTCFTRANLYEPFDLGRKYDLAISLEVAEHLPQESAATFIDSLTGLSDVVLFSAAIPGQGGINHLNEQWPNYWEAYFRERSFMVLDVIRNTIWNDETIPVWYRQNILLFVKENYLQKLPAQYRNHCRDLERPLAIVHPSLYKEKLNVRMSAKDCVMAIRDYLFNIVKRSIKKLINARRHPDY